MAGVDSVIRVVAAPVVLLVIIFVSWVGVTLYDPISAAIDGPPASLGWGDPRIYFFMALGLVSLSLIVIVWLWVSPIRRDVRQDIDRGGPF
ncbi:hypothetical protein EGH24_13855 [Halonotius terrestris]|uniref:Uncharacterized protein n=1 Tax=Halonotius terrestris TaxID=2487750 RepID=A0A8J8P7P8_9EURY|nr:hypothetical protein [Halonotius terrestris]TQQ78602.1 hypothetical protein EGH24_13855 [Halonotius terrestris]